MGGFSSITGDETIMFADNASFDGTDRGGKMTTDGQLWIGSTASPHVRRGLPTGIGYLANTPVMSAIYGNGTLSYENRSWMIPYVVDPSSTVGSRGTFTTIQAAINQVAADGFTISNGNIPIYVRKGTYTENLTIPSLVGIYLYSISGDGLTQSGAQVIVIGNVTFATPGASLISDGILFSANGVGNAWNLTNSFSSAILNGGADTMTGSGGITMINSNLNACTISGGTNLFDRCFLGGATCQFSGGTSTIRNSNCGNIQVTSSPLLNLFNCVFQQSGFIGSTGSFTGTIFAENIIAGNASSLFFVTGGSITYSNITIPAGAQNRFINGGSPTSITTAPHCGGNLKNVRKTAISTSAVRGDMYIGVTDTSAARTITLPNATPTATACFQGQVLTIKDESNGAATNNITITPSSGTIDNAASLVINTNLGKATIIYDGTNWWSI